MNGPRVAVVFRLEGPEERTIKSWTAVVGRTGRLRGRTQGDLQGV